MLGRVWRISIGAVLGIGLAFGLFALVLIGIAIVLYKFQPKFLGVLLILGGTLFLVAATGWWIGRTLWHRVMWLVRNSNAPEVNDFLMNVSAALVIVGI
jgi:hypothetical protein